MIQKNFVFHELAEALKHVESLALLKKHSHCHDALLTIFVSGLTATEGQILINALNNELNDVKRIGLSVYNLEGKEDVIIDFNLLLSQEANFTTFEIPCEAGAELQAAEELKRTLASLENVQGIQLFPVNPTLHVTHFLEAISLGQEEIPIFGTMAMVSNLSDSSFELPVDCFGLGQSIMRCGFCGIVYSGSDLQIYMDYILGWKPIGREMPITLAESRGMGESILATIDGAPAFDIYKRYLGIDWSEDIIENVWAFPLMIRRKNVNLCYVPMFSDKKILRCAGSIFPGETIRFSYCTREEILDASYQGSERMKTFAPQAVFLNLCGNRAGYLGDEAHLEWNFYKNNNPELVYFHGYSEISYQNGKGGVLNSAFVAVGIKEGGQQTANLANYSMLPKSRFTPQGKVPLSYLVAHFFHEMTNELVHFQQHLEHEVAKKTKENASLSLHIVQTLAQTIDAKDTYTNGHSSRVAKYAREIARRAGYSPAQQEAIFMIGLLHDVGKIGVPDEIINKPGRLTDEEFAIIKTHPSVGAKILKKIKEMPKLVTGALYHHERYDGRGYPEGLHGKTIPEEARIIAVADAYDAMTSNRSYRSVLAQATVRAEIVKGQGSQFDPEFARIMLAMIDEDKNYVMQEGPKDNS